MYPFQRLLIPTDFSVCAEAAYRQGLFLAQRYGAEVHLLHVASSQRAPHRKRLRAWLDRATPGKADGRVGRHEHWHGITIRRTLVSHPDPTSAILGYADTHEVDGIVIGAHGDDLAHRFLSRGGSCDLLGQTAGQVVRHARVPVLTVMQRMARASENVRSILVPVDFSPLSLLAITQARDLASFYDARLEVLHVIERPGVSPPRTNGHDPLDVMRRELMDAYDATRGAQVSAGFHVTTGVVHREIQRIVQHRAPDLLVVGAHSEVGQDMLGEVAARVVQSSPCSVLTVRGMVPKAGRSAPRRTGSRGLKAPGEAI